MQDQKLTLFHANWSFCSQMVRVALFELNVHFNEQHIRLCDQYAEGENLDKNFLSLNISKPSSLPSLKSEIFKTLYSLSFFLGSVLSVHRTDSTYPS